MQMLDDASVRIRTCVGTEILYYHEPSGFLSLNAILLPASVEVLLGCPCV